MFARAILYVACFSGFFVKKRHYMFIVYIIDPSLEGTYVYSSCSRFRTSTTPSAHVNTEWLKIHEWVCFSGGNMERYRVLVCWRNAVDSVRVTAAGYRLRSVQNRVH